MNQKICLVAIFWFFLCPLAVGQNSQSQTKADSAKIYKDIEKISKKNKYFKFIYSLIFRPVSPVPKNKKKVEKKPDIHFQLAQNKPIRNIEIITLDPFGLNINDTSVKAKNFLPRTGNKLHIKSRRITLLNLLIFTKNSDFDSLSVKESERLIRAQDYIREVRLQLKFNKTNDSVDIVFFVQDLWSIELSGNISTSSAGLDITDKNFLGLGHQFQQAISKESKQDFAFESNYYIRNIRNTFININLHYKVNPDNSYLKRFLLERSFYSSFTRWAGGILFDQQFHTDSILYIPNAYKFQKIKYNMQDYWLGKAWPINLDQSAYSRSTNLIVAGRFLRVHYLERPQSGYIPTYSFAQERSYLISIGINTRLYLQDKYIFSYGLTEDIPTGKVFNITSGIQYKNSIPRFYTGLKISWADYFNWGYFSNSIEFGTFFRKGFTEQGTLKFSLSYFTELFQLGRWNFRQFIKPSLVIGLNRLDSDRIFIKPDSITSSIHIFQKDEEWSGVHRLTVTLQTQSYAPWNFYGFRFGPFFSVTLAILSEKKPTFYSSKLFTQIDIGILIKNEFLLFNYFQFSFSFIPIFPGGRNNLFKANAYKTNDFGMPEFDTGKPTFVNYQ